MEVLYSPKRHRGSQKVKLGNAIVTLGNARSFREWYKPRKFTDFMGESALGLSFLRRIRCGRTGGGGGLWIGERGRDLDWGTCFRDLKSQNAFYDQVGTFKSLQTLRLGRYNIDIMKYVPLSSRKL